MTNDISPIAVPGARIKGPPPNLGDDLLRGAGAIAEFLFGDLRTPFHHHREGQPPLREAEAATWPDYRHLRRPRWMGVVTV